MKSSIDKALGNPLPLAAAAALLVGVVYLIGRQTVKDVASAAGGIVTGNNAATAGTPYEGAGVAGTVGAVVDKASGGIFSTIGGWLGGKVYDWTHAEYDPNKGFYQDPQTLREGAANTDGLWGSLGGVELRR